MSSDNDSIGIAAARQTGIERTGVSVTVPSAPICRLSYYTKCVTNDLGLDIVDDDLINFKSATYLSRTRQEVLIRIAAEVLNPTNIVGKLIFEDGGLGLCGTSSNQFFKLTQVDTVLAVQSTAMIGGNVTQVHKIMVFKQSWLQQNYYTPIRLLMSTRATPASSPSSYDECDCCDCFKRIITCLCLAVIVLVFINFI